MEINHVCPVFKGGDTSDIKTYRPISIINIISKIFEMYIADTLMSYLEPSLNPV